MVWHLETIRATVLAPNIKALGLLKWQELVGGSPPQTLNPAQDTFLELGFIERYAFTIREQPGRSDLIAAARQDPTTIFPASLGDLADFLPGFMEITKRWLSKSDSVKRLAVFCTIFEGHRTSEDALEAILTKVPSFKKKPGEVLLDFLVQINRPRKSTIDPNKDINRFVQWSVRFIMLSLPVFPNRPSAPSIPSPRAQADIDINTAGEADIPNALITQHLDEMASFMLEIAQNGDIR